MDANNYEYYRMQRQPSSEMIEDCRDYLRTGRCKYGASCKYNHPANVQSGGGLIGLLDPSEPMYPHRPNEPVCQYYMKHGTCKFGQACKFNHPPLSNLSNGGTAPSGAGPRRIDAPQLAMNTVGTDANGQPLMVQFLPQRPDEADCIYFLKNGKCKYGATCRYHHPMKYHSNNATRGNGRLVDTRRQPPRQDMVPIQYVTQTGPSPGYPQGQYIITDSPVKFMSIDQGQPQTYQSVPVYQQHRDNVIYGSPAAGTAATEQISSQSSIASSYAELEQDPWLRARRNGSGGSLKAYSNGHAAAASMPTSSSDGAIARQRSVSAGGASEAIRRIDSNGSWRDHAGGGRRPPARPGRAGARSSQSPRRGPGDEGLTMMTSALLNMLDTPEEGFEGTDEEYLYHHGREQYMQPPSDMDPALFQRLTFDEAPPEAAAEEPSYTHTSYHEVPAWYSAQPSQNADGGDSRSGRGSPHNSDVGLYLP